MIRRRERSYCAFQVSYSLGVQFVHQNCFDLNDKEICSCEKKSSRCDITKGKGSGGRGSLIYMYMKLPKKMTPKKWASAQKYKSIARRAGVLLASSF